ncbi:MULTISPECIES: ABC transporter substrate-binding protein [unclassified Providencia]|uniref:ABC transporter substrate-binding protein n=1 Tax=unclassified Providencia TaxID=2633465 RepID=UPI00234BD896|nr:MULTISPECIES: iron-siderophore ABC transporter substrate-binding protein [unclassified Providencia]
MRLRINLLGLILLTSTLLCSFYTRAYSVTDSRGIVEFNSPPQRVVVLDWDLLEQLLTLEITPVGATELESYQQWVVDPVVPSSVKEVGTRAEPNLEQIAALKPDVIIASSAQEDLLPLLEKIAPVVYLSNFARQDDSGLVAIAHFKTLARLFEKTSFADEYLVKMDKRFAELRSQLERAFTTTPSVAVIRFSSLSTIFLYTENSTLNYVLEQLALKPAILVPARPWGIEQRRINSLQFINDGYVLYIKPFVEEKKLNDSILWQSMPFVKQGRINSVRPVWNYGGVFSLQLMAEALTESLSQVAPHNDN